VERKPVIALVVVVVGAIAAGLVLQRCSDGAGPSGQGHGSGPVASDALDDAIVGYVYDTMVLKAAQDVARRCAMPTRKVSGLLKVKTESGVIELVGWTWRTPPPGWTPESQRCVEASFTGVTEQPPRLKVPAGREYELDAEVTFPPPPPSDPR
jgi:hypothetical protein